MTALLNEHLHTDEWLKTILGGDVTLEGLLASGVYADVIPTDKQLPAVRYSVASPGTDLTVINGIRIWANPLYLVAGVVEGSPVPLVPIADRIDTLLHRVTGSTSTIQVVSCVRERPYKLTETPTPDGRVFRHAGGYYRIKVQAK
jgi:hypothetical protein